MADNSYQQILKMAQKLSKQEQERLAGELAQIAATRNSGKHSILELEGLGKEVWEGIDPDEYIAQERDSWD
jgi:hypothetical protein